MRSRSLVGLLPLAVLAACQPTAQPASTVDCDCAAEPYEWAAEPVDLSQSEKTVYSTDGEDGVIEKIFEIIEPTHKFSVEFGAGDGKMASNSYRLIKDEGWASLQIEGSPQRAAKMRENLAEFPKVIPLEAWVWPGNVEILFEENGVPRDFDLLVIDIDSNDYYVWRAIQWFRPKVVLIEVNPLYPPPQKMVIDFHPMNYWDYSGYLGASLQTLYDLGQKKGYELVYHMSHGGNAIFVDEKYFPLFGIRENSPEKLYREARPEFMKHLANLGNPVIYWKELKIPKKILHHR
jgi:hypothetical protein